MRTSHIWPAIALLTLLWPVATALAQDVWVTTPDGTLSVEVPLGHPGFGAGPAFPPCCFEPSMSSPTEAPAVDQWHVIGRTKSVPWFLVAEACPTGAAAIDQAEASHANDAARWIRLAMLRGYCPDGWQ